MVIFYHLPVKKHEMLFAVTRVTKTAILW